MHLRNYPHYFVKDGERRAVYYTAQVRELLALGWRREEAIESKSTDKPASNLSAAPASTPEVEKIEADVVIEEVSKEQETKDAKLPIFDFMTKPELLQYALDKGVDLPNNMLKAELVAECKRLANG